MSETITDTDHALAVEDLQLAYNVRGIPREVLRGVTFHVRPGEAYGLVGESGCGKSTTAYAAVRYLPANGVITGGRILVDGADVTQDVRARRCAGSAPATRRWCTRTLGRPSIRA